MSDELKRGQEILLEVESAAFEGKSVCRRNGFVIFVEGAVPGDVVKARILKLKKNYAEAKVVTVERPSPLRVEPRCRHFGVCGGCKWQHVDYAAQLRFKQQHVRDAFERIGGFSDLPFLPILGSDELYFYRNKMEFSFARQEWLDVAPLRSGVQLPPSSVAPMRSGVQLPPSSVAPLRSGVQLPASSVARSGKHLPPSSDSPLTIHDSPLTTHHSPIFLGLHVPQRYDKVLDLRECHLQSEVSNQILIFVREFARRNKLSVYSSKESAGYLRFLVIRQSSASRNLPLFQDSAYERDSKSGTVQRDKRTNELMVNLVTFDDRPDVMKRFTSELSEEIPSITTVVNTINSKKAQVAYGDVEKVYRGQGVIHERIGRYLFNISASSFFQTNTAQAEKLYEVAKSFGELRPTDIVYDLYSGTGSIAIYISDAVEHVIGVESVESAVRDAERNASLNNISNCTFVLGDLKDCLTRDRRWMEFHRKADVLIIDPPRSGMHPKIVKEILELAPPRIVYVSCNPATQARDVKMLCASKYELVKLQPVDMFPHTYHIENVALVTLR